MKKDDCVKKISDAIREYAQESLFSNNEKVLEDACVQYLQFMGYSITKPTTYNNAVSKLEDLVSLFYALFEQRYPAQAIKAYRNFKRDLATAKRFVENRVEATGFDKKIAMKECAEIIQAFFDNLSEMKVKGPIRFELFGQKNMSWVTEKTIYLMNKKSDEVKEAALKKRLDAIAEKAEKEYEIGYDLESILKRMEEE